MSEADEQTAATATGREIWIEKYRPQSLDDIHGQEAIVERLQSYIEQDDIPTCFWGGLPVQARRPLPPPSLDRCTATTTGAGTSWSSTPPTSAGSTWCAIGSWGFARSSFGGDFRIVFLDEADSLTDEAQAALRRTMEQFSDNTRFILSCNYSSKIIDPIQSRCAVFRFSPLSDAAVAAQTREIAAAEGIEVTDEGVDALVYAADGDMRRAINSLQAAATTGEIVDEEAVYAITATARPEEIESMVTNALHGDFTRARATLDTPSSRRRGWPAAT